MDWRAAAVIAALGAAAGSPTAVPSAPPGAPTNSPSPVPTTTPSAAPAGSAAAPPSAPPTRSPAAAGIASGSTPAGSSISEPTGAPAPTAAAPRATGDCGSCPDELKMTEEACSEDGKCVNLVRVAFPRVTLGSSASPELCVGAAEGSEAEKGSCEAAGIKLRREATCNFTAPAGGTVTQYTIIYGKSVTPERVSVGFVLQAQFDNNSEWKAVDTVPPEWGVLHLEPGKSVTRPINGTGTGRPRSWRMLVTHVQGDASYVQACPFLLLLVAATGGVAVCLAAFIACCCYCGGYCCAAMFDCGVADVVRHKPATPSRAFWVGCEDLVMGKVLEAWEQFEKEWHQTRENVAEEAAQWLQVPDGKGDPRSVLREHATDKWVEEARDSNVSLHNASTMLLEVARRFTHEGGDTDRICGFDGSPQPFASYKEADDEHPYEAKKAWDTYAHTCKIAAKGRDSRNCTLYDAVTQACTTAFVEGCDGPWDSARPVLKQAALLASAAAYARPTHRRRRVPGFSAQPLRLQRIMEVTPARRRAIAALRPGTLFAFAAPVTALTTSSRLAADELGEGRAGNCVLMRVTGRADQARALPLSFSVQPDTGEHLIAMGTIFKVRRVSYGRALVRYVCPTQNREVSLADICSCLCQPLLILDLEWHKSPVIDPLDRDSKGRSSQWWCNAARTLCASARIDARRAELTLGLREDLGPAGDDEKISRDAFVSYVFSDLSKPAHSRFVGPTQLSENASPFIKPQPLNFHEARPLPPVLQPYLEKGEANARRALKAAAARGGFPASATSVNLGPVARPGRALSPLSTPGDEREIDLFANRPCSGPTVRQHAQNAIWSGMSGGHAPVEASRRCTRAQGTSMQRSFASAATASDQLARTPSPGACTQLSRPLLEL